MKDYLPFIVVGLTNGSVYALAAMGLVVTYRTSGVFNFAHGAVAMIGAYLFFTLQIYWDVPSLWAFVLVVGVGGPLMGLALALLFRVLAGASTAATIVASLGLLVALQSFVVSEWGWGGEIKRVRNFYPQGSFKLLGTTVGYEQLTLFAVGAGAALALVTLLHRSHLGLRMRAVVDDPALTDLTGDSSGRVTAAAWMLGSSFACGSGVLIAPLVGVDSNQLTLLVVYAFGAAAIGRLSSIPWTYAGGVLIGVAASIPTKWVARPEFQFLQGLPDSLPFIALIAMLVFGRSLAGSHRNTVKDTVTRQPVPYARWHVIVGYSAVCILAVAMPWLVADYRLFAVTSTVIFVLIYRSLGVLVGLARQVSLAHAVFVGLGAASMAQLRERGVPFAAAVMISGVIAVPVGVVVTLPAIRLSGLPLALATFGFGLLVQRMLYQRDFLFGFGSRRVARPEVLGIDMSGDQAFYFLVLAVVAVSLLLLQVVAGTRTGRLMAAMADSPAAMESLGINPRNVRLLVFSVSVFFAGVAGSLYATLFQTVSADNFGYGESLKWLTVIVTMGAVTLAGAILGAASFIALPNFWTIDSLTEVLTIFFGLQAISMARKPNGFVGDCARFINPRGRRQAGTTVESIPDGAAAALPVALER